MPPQEDLADVISLISDIRHSKLYNSYDVALRTERLLQKLISQGNWNNAQELMNLIKAKAQRLMSALPQEATPVNIMRHVLKIIREVYEVISKSKIEGGQQSLHQYVKGISDGDIKSYENQVPELRSTLLDHFLEYKVELETSIENIAAQASEHIHTDEMILTFGKSNTVERFLKEAAKTRQFQVIVVESAPSCHGHKMAASLAKSDLRTIVISDAAVFAMMSRVNKVIIGTHTIMANGGLRAACGVHAVALAAQHYSVPVLVLAHMYKLSPVHLCSYEQDAFNICASPANVLPYSNGPVTERVHVYNPVFDYVPPELVTLFVSHQGGNAPSYVYRLLTELYHPSDYDL